MFNAQFFISVFQFRKPLNCQRKKTTRWPIGFSIEQKLWNPISHFPNRSCKIAAVRRCSLVGKHSCSAGFVSMRVARPGRPPRAELSQACSQQQFSVSVLNENESVCQGNSGGRGGINWQSCTNRHQRIRRLTATSMAY